jgi:hypothetical protein
MCDSKQKIAYEHGSGFERLPRYGKKEDTDRPASTNSNYVINNITTNITCMQVLTIMLLMICNGKNPGSLTSGTFHNKFSKMLPSRFTTVATDDSTHPRGAVGYSSHCVSGALRNVS